MASKKSVIVSPALLFPLMVTQLCVGPAFNRYRKKPLQNVSGCVRDFPFQHIAMCIAVYCSALHTLLKKSVMTYKKSVIAAPALCFPHGYTQVYVWAPPLTITETSCRSCRRGRGRPQTEAAFPASSSASSGLSWSQNIDEDMTKIDGFL